MKTNMTKTHIMAGIWLLLLIVNAVVKYIYFWPAKEIFSWTVLVLIISGALMLVCGIFSVIPASLLYLLNPVFKWAGIKEENSIENNMQAGIVMFGVLIFAAAAVLTAKPYKSLRYFNSLSDQTEVLKELVLYNYEPHQISGTFDPLALKMDGKEEYYRYRTFALHSLHDTQIFYDIASSLREKKWIRTFKSDKGVMLLDGDYRNKSAKYVKDDGDLFYFCLKKLKEANRDDLIQSFLRPKVKGRRFETWGDTVVLEDSGNFLVKKILATD